jgi:hypothetical protein
VGWSEAEFDALGQDFHTRGRRTDEILEAVHACWTTDPTSHEGEFFAFDDIRVLPKPAHPIDVWVGGSSDAAFGRAKRHPWIAGFQLIGLKPDTIVDPIKRLRDEHPDADAFTISLRTGWDPQGMPPEEIAAELEQFEAAGVQHVTSAPWRSSVDEWIRSMELLADIAGLARGPAARREDAT